MGKFVTGAEGPTILSWYRSRKGSQGGGGKAPGVVNRPNKFWSQVEEHYDYKGRYVDNQELLRPDYNVDKKPGNICLWIFMVLVSCSKRN